MRAALNEQLHKEITRKQFLSYLLAAVLTVFGFNNLIRLLTGSSHGLLPHDEASGRHGFGSSKFGV